MNISIDLRSLENMRGNMKERAAKIADAVDMIITKSVYVLEGKEKFYSPVRTGRMRASIGDGIIFGKLFGSVGPTVDYAKYVNARIPFMSAAAQESLKDITKIAEDEINKALK